MRFSWSTTCRSVFSLPQEFFFRNHRFWPRNATFHIPLLIAWSNDKHSGKNTPTMKTDVVLIQIYYRYWTKIIPAVSPGPAKSLQVLFHCELQYGGVPSRGPARCGPKSKSFPFSPSPPSAFIILRTYSSRSAVMACNANTVFPHSTKKSWSITVWSKFASSTGHFSCIPENPGQNRIQRLFWPGNVMDRLCQIGGTGFGRKSRSDPSHVGRCAKQIIGQNFHQRS